jgi:thiamine biosynthesis protein ThiS
MNASLSITVNAEPRTMQTGATLGDLVAQMQLDMRKVAIERNLTIVPRSQYATTAIMDGDAIEIVGFIGGG